VENWDKRLQDDENTKKERVAFAKKKTPSKYNQPKDKDTLKDKDKTLKQTLQDGKNKKWIGERVAIAKEDICLIYLFVTFSV